MDIKFPADQLHGPRVSLRRHELSSAELIFLRVDSDRERLRRYLPWVEGIRAVADEEKYIRSTYLQWEEGRAFDFGIYVGEDYIGNAGVHTISWGDERCELGYWLSGPAEGKGFMGEAVGLLETEVFRIGFHRIEIRCDRRNVRSAAVPRRMGYTLEGILREDVIEAGARRDTMLWSKLKTDEIPDA